MVKWIGMFSLSLQRLKNAWMDNFPLSALSEYSTMGHIVLDMINLAYQPTTKVAWETCDLCHIRAKTSIPCSCSRHAWRRRWGRRTSCTSNNKTARRTWSNYWWLRPCTSGSSDLLRPNGYRKERRPPVWAGSNCFSGATGVKEFARARRGDLDLGQKVGRWSTRNIINKLSNEHNLKDLHLEHCQMSTAQFKKRTTHLDIPGRIYDLHQHAVETCPFCSSKSRDLKDLAWADFVQNNLDTSST